MSLKPAKGNMYNFISHVWNPVKGLCSNNCVYCYVKRFPVKQLRLDEKELKTFHGKGNFIFVCSGTDLFNDDVPREWIMKVLEQCKKYPENKYLFQSKNPKRFSEFKAYFPENTILGTTIETNRNYPNISKAPTPVERALAMINITLPKIVTIEPIIDFDIDELSQWIINIKPEWVNIGADSNYKKTLPEPEPEKIMELVKIIKRAGIKVKIKDNLKRLIDTRDD